MENTQTTSERPSLNVFSCAMVVGMFTFFAARAAPGGLSGVQGFFAGVLATGLVFVAAEVLTRLKPTAQSRRDLVSATDGNGLLATLPFNAGKVSITRAESEKEVTIQIHVAK